MSKPSDDLSKAILAIEERIGRNSAARREWRMGMEEALLIVRDLRTSKEQDAPTLALGGTLAKVDGEWMTLGQVMARRSQRG